MEANLRFIEIVFTENLTSCPLAQKLAEPAAQPATVLPLILRLL